MSKHDLSTVEGFDAALGVLPEYSATVPTGTNLGKRWKRADKTPEGKLIWLIGEYVVGPAPGTVGIRWYERPPSAHWTMEPPEEAGWYWCVNFSTDDSPVNWMQLRSVGKGQVNPDALRWSERVKEPPLPTGEVKSGSRPLPMLLHCPACHVQHVDRGVWSSWPHRTHRCRDCQHEWRPAHIYTVGVAALPEEEKK